MFVTCSEHYIRTETRKASIYPSAKDVESKMIFSPFDEHAEEGLWEEGGWHKAA